MSTQPQGDSSTLIPVSEDPHCRESSLNSLDTLITPTDRFYIRSHFSDVPSLDRSSWQLVVDGEVSQALTFSFEDILAMPSKEIVTTLECAGNSRSYTTPPSEGLAFRHGAVSTARWKGVTLRHLLDSAGLKETALEVVFEGADHGQEEEDGVAFALNYRRSLTVDLARQPDILLAYEMNGEALTPLHGFPLRMIVPKWYAMASVKWLTRINVVAEPFTGFFQHRRYVMINEGPEDSLERQPVTMLKVKSLIASPRHGEVVQPGSCTISGFAWSGEGEVNRVEVSADGGHTWQNAKLLGQADQNAWRQWEFIWQTSQPGHFVFKARATDSNGNTQPSAIPWNFRGYANNAIHTIAIEVPALREIPS
ncbi:MAG: sulfite oxidase [Chloroflexi bacterium]|nr:sulfite oxidase [Chloroflexota bacterium]